MRLLLAALTLAAVCSAAEPKYEMTTYAFCLVKKGPKWTPEQTPETKKLGEGHMANIKHMAEIGKLAVAGPFRDNWEAAGIFIFNASVEEAEKLSAEDPAVKAGRFTIECHPWFAAKGLTVAPPK